MKNLLRRLTGKFLLPSDSDSSNLQPAENSGLETESLEPRMLFSAAPVDGGAVEEAPADSGSDAQEPAVETVVVSQTAAQDTAAAVTEIESATEAAPPVVAEATAIDAAQEVNLVDLDEETAVQNQQILAATIEGSAAPGSLDDAAVQALWDEGTRRWVESGISEDQLASLQSATLEIHDLLGNLLGAATGTSIVLDDDGAGIGWFVDATPGEDSEFLTSNGAPSGVDLLSVILHEQGHILGLDGNGETNDVMNGIFAESERRLPSAGQADGADAGSLEGVHYALTPNTTILSDNFSAGTVNTTFRAYESNIDTGWRKAPGYGAVTVSAWTITGGVAENASTVAGGGYPTTQPSETPLINFFSGVASADTYLNLRFDYSVAAGDTLWAHLWGYTGTASTPGGFVSNIEGSANGNMNVSEGAAGSTLDGFNLKDGATSGYGAAANAISGPLTGSGTVNMIISLDDLAIPGVTTVADLSYYLIQFAKNEDGTAGTTSIDNFSFTTLAAAGNEVVWDDGRAGNLNAAAGGGDADQNWTTGTNWRFNNIGPAPLGAPPNDVAPISLDRANVAFDSGTNLQDATVTTIAAMPAAGPGGAAVISGGENITVHSVRIGTNPGLSYGGDGRVENSGGTITVTNGAGGTGSNFILGADGDRSGVYIQTAGTLEMNRASGTTGHAIIVGASNGEGFFGLSGGTVNADVSGFRLSENGTSHGSFVMDGGTLNVAGGNFETANNGTGVVTMNAGTYTHGTVGNLIVGQGSTSDATFNMNGGTIDIHNQIRVANQGIGLFDQTGGIVNVGTILDLANNAGGDSVGTVQISGGNLNVGDRVNSDLVIGNENNATSTSLVEVSGTGALRVSDEIRIAQTGANSSGTLDIQGGVVDSRSNVIVGVNGAGTATMSGGTLTIGADLPTASPSDFSAVTTTGVAGAALIIGSNGGSSGSFTLSDGTIDVSASILMARNSISTATLTVGDGTTNPVIDLNTGAGGNFETAENGMGTFDFRSGTINVGNSNWITGQSGTSEANVTIGGFSGAATLNVNGGDGNRDWNTNTGDGNVDVLTNGTVNVGRSMNLGNNGAQGGLVLDINGGTVNVGTVSGASDVNYRTNGVRDEITLRGGGTFDITRNFNMNQGTGILNVIGTGNTFDIGNAYSQNAASTLNFDDGASGISSIDATGAANLAGTVAFTFDDLTSATTVGDIILIDSASRSGTFTTAEGAAVHTFADGSQYQLTYTYNAATGALTGGNDVALVAVAETTATVDVGGNLVLDDTLNVNTNDTLTVTLNGTNVRIASVNSIIARDIPNAVQVDPNTIEIPLTDFSGGVVVNAGGGDDVVNLDGTATTARAVTINGDAGTDAASVNSGISVSALTVDTETTDLDANVTTTGDITFNSNVDQGAADVTLTATNIAFNGDTTLHPTQGSNTFTLDASGAATNSAGNLFDMNGGRLRLIGGTEVVNDGSFETGGTGPIFATNDTGNKITNNGTFTHNGSQLRLYVEITNTSMGNLIVDNPSGNSEIQFKAPSGNGPGGAIVNQGTTTVSEDTARFDESGTITNESGGTINFAVGSSSTISESVTLTNESGGIVTMNDNVTVDGTAGTITNESGGIINVNDGVLTLSGSGTVTNESGGVVNLDSNLTINGSTATFTNDSGGNVNLVGGALTIFLNDVNAEFTNNGTVTWVAGAAGNKAITGTGTFLNSSTGIFNHNHGPGGSNDNLELLNNVTFQNDGTFNLNDRGDVDLEGNAEFVNNGNLIKTAAGGDPSFIFTFGTTGGTFTQTANGTVEAQAGRLRIATENASSDASGTWTANGGDIELAGEWTGTITGTASGAGDILVTNSNNTAVMSNFAAGTGGITFDVDGNGLTWNQASIDTADGNVTNADTMTIAGTTGLAKILTGGGELITASGATTTVTGTASATGGSLLRVNDGGVLEGDGAFNGPVVTDDGALVQPGEMSIGTLGTGDFTADAGSTLELDLEGGAGAGVAGGHDQLVVGGTVTLNNSDLDLLIGASFTAPAAGTEIILIDNDLADPVVGEFNGLPDGTIITLAIPNPSGPPPAMVPSQLFEVDYQGGDGNDVSLVVLAETATTNIWIDAAGNLKVTDIDGANSADNLTIRVDGTEVVIADPDNALGTLINGATQPSVHEIRVDTSLFGGMLMVETLDGDDSISIGNLGNAGTGGAGEFLPGSITVDGGDGFDNILYTGDDSELTTGSDASFTGEEIDFQLSDLTTTGGGSITLDGTGGTGSNHQGIHLWDSDLTANGGGTITLNGSGGDTGNSNHGVFLTAGSEVTTDSGNIDIDGSGGGGAIAGRGVMIYSGSSLSAGGSGTLTIDGTGAAGSLQNEGVFFNADTSASVEDGDMTITGTGGGTMGGGVGVWLIDTQLESTGAGNINISGTSAGTGFSNSGVQLWGTDIDVSSGTGSVTISGSGSAGGTSNSLGVQLSNVDIDTGTDASIDIDGTGAGTSSNNVGVQLAADTNLTVTGDGTISVNGTGSSAGTINNDGVNLGPSTDLTVENGDLTIGGTGGGGTSSQGVEASSAVLTGTGSGNIAITGTSTGAGSVKQGISLTNTTVTTATGSGSITLSGSGSTAATSLNDGVKLSNTDLTTGGNGSIAIDGTGGGTALGVLNNGVQLAGGSTVIADGSGTVTIAGTAGNSLLLNRGVYITGIGSSISSGSGNITIDGTGNGSASLNRGIEATFANISTGGDVTLRGSGSATGGGNFNTGIHLQGTAATGVNAGGSLTITGNGGTGTMFNEGVRIIGGALTGALNLTGTANGATTSIYNTGVYILSADLSAATGSIAGTGGGLTSSLGNFNHGVFMQNTSFGGAAPTGTAGFGLQSEDTAGNFF